MSRTGSTVEFEVARLVKTNLAFHSLNKGAEVRLGLSLVQYHLLATLRDRPGCSPQRLADAVGIDPSSLTQSLKRLKKKGAIFVGKDPKDSRKKILTLTRAGREFLERFTEGVLRNGLKVV